MSRRLRILLVEPYFTGSHRAWAEGYAAASRHEVVLCTHEGAFWKWRMHGAALTLAAEIEQMEGEFDVVLASSMTNLPALLGAARRRIGDVPVAVYFHESQLSYPLSPLDRPDFTYAMINWASAAVADRVFFNSEYHLASFFGEVVGFLGRFPDRRHIGLIDAVRHRASVLPVGVDLARIDRAEPAELPGRGPVLLWNARWEHDKGPDEFVDALLRLDERGREFRLILAGEQFVDEPAGFETLRETFGERLVHAGYAPDDLYVRLLRASDIVVSTAHQEFFGISITEAVFAGAFPVVPRRLVYPERIPAPLHDRCCYVDRPDDLVDWAIAHPRDRRGVVELLRPVMAEFDWPRIAPRYDEELEALSRG